MLYFTPLTLISSLLLITSVFAVNVASLLQRQVSSTTSDNVISIFPAGIQSINSSLESDIPLSCDIGCYNVIGSYYYCFITDTLLDGTTFDRSNCSTYICNQTLHDQYQQCLNCIIANGDERPFGYYSNSSITAIPTYNSNADNLADRFPKPNGLLNSTQANLILKNITEYCIGVSSTLTGVGTITAIPTTTGPYFTSWTRGQNVQLSIWPGLASYSSIPVYTIDTAAAGGATSSVSRPTQISSQTTTASSASNAARTSSASPSTSTSAESGVSRRLRFLWFYL